MERGKKKDLRIRLASFDGGFVHWGLAPRLVQPEWKRSQLGPASRAYKDRIGGLFPFFLFCHVGLKKNYLQPTLKS